MITLRKMERDDCEIISHAFADIGWDKPVELFIRYVEEQQQNVRFCFIAFHNQKFAGYVTLLRTSAYEHFSSHTIPEISDLNVLPLFRNQGIGTLLIQACENTAKQFSDTIGLGVGLTKDYTPALHLYLTLGYHFDGQGIAYNGKILKHHQPTLVDDALTMYLVKEKKNA